MGKITKKELSESLLQIINDASRIETITGTLDNLNTDDKSNLVNAINEIIQETNNSLENKASKDIATTSADGLMSSIDKIKLNGIAAGANNYIHPSTHPASIIAQDSSNRFVTDVEKATWSAKASKDIATTSTNGLMSSADKSKLDGIAAGANNYTHPSTHPASIIVQDSSNRFVTDAEKTRWNDKYTKSEVDNKISEVISSLDWKESVNTYDDILTTYPNPIDGWTVNTKDKDETWRYDGAKWVLISANNIPLATQTTDGKMSSTDKAKLDGIAAGANKYVHPNDANTRHVTDTEKATWNAKASTAVASTSANGLMSSTDKSKLDGIAAGANNYVHPNDAGTRHVTDSEKATWNAKASTAVATTGANGLMSSTDKAKLDGIATGANKVVVNNTLTSTSTAEALSAAQGKILDEKIKNKFEIIRKDLTDQTIDLDTINLSSGTVTEQYYCEKTTAGAEKITNAPVKEPFVLDVKLIRWVSSSSYITQQIFTSATTKLTYERFCTNGTWTAWTVVARFTATPTNGQILIADSNGIKTSGYTIATSVPSGAKFTDTVYTHPSTHPASIIAQDANNRFVTDAEKAAWNSKPSTAVASTSANGLMSSTDKSKLDGIAAGANNYVHPGSGTNPHGTTKADVGLGNVNNWGATTAVNSTSTTTYATASAVKQAYDLAASKANASHGNHVPTTQTANNAVFLRNDNTWQTVTPANIGAAAASHTHSYLPLSGGTLTGGINYSGGGYNNVAIAFKNGDANGAGIAMGAGGTTVVGSGESAKAVLDNVSAADETLWLASDGSIKIATNMQNGYPSRVESTIDGAGNLNMAGSVTVNKKVKMNYNSTTESLDFIFV